MYNRLSTLVFVVLMITSCNNTYVVHQNRYVVEAVQTSENQRQPQCEPFVLPEIRNKPAVPTLKDISDSTNFDKIAAARFVKHIGDLRLYIKETEKDIEVEYTRYKSECLQK